VDARFVSNQLRTAYEGDLKIELERSLKTRPAEHWLQVIHEAGVPVARVLNVAEAVEHPQTKARNMLIEAGGLKMPGNPIKISGYPDPSVRAGAPALKQHGDALRQEFATAANEANH
jgi:CoA:oxalate CoA-transferase